MPDLNEPYAAIQVLIENLVMDQQQMAIEAQIIQAKREQIKEIKDNLVHALSKQMERDKENT